MIKQMESYQILTANEPPAEVSNLVSRFFELFLPLELHEGGRLILLVDEKSGAYYVPCHLKASDFSPLADFNATIDDSDDDED